MSDGVGAGAADDRDHRGSSHDLHAEVDAERAAAAHWRRVAAQHREALDSIRRRKAVRAVLALDRRVRPLYDRWTSTRRRLARGFGRGGLATTALIGRGGLERRRAALAAAIEGLPLQERSSRTVTIVTVTDRMSDADVHLGRDCGVERIVVVVGDASGVVEGGDDRVIVGTGLAPAAAAALGARHATNELVCFLAPTTEPLEPRWLDRLAAEIGGRVVAATPTLVHPERPVAQATPHDLRVRTVGLDLALSDGGVPVARHREAGSEVAPRGVVVDVVAASGACLVVDRRAYEDAGGLAPLDDLDAAVFDLCQRMRERGGAIVAVSSSVALDHRPMSSWRELTSPVESGAWQSVIDRHGPSLVRAVPGEEHRPASFAFTVAAPSTKVATRWGDWHLAQAMARSLRRLGHRVLVQASDRAGDAPGRSTDVHVVVRGLAPVRRTPGQHHVLWVISHPEEVDHEELEEADLVLVASHRFALALRERTSTPVEVFLQATDHRRFRPVAPDPAHAHPIVVVAKTRDVLRPAVANALEAGLRPAIYGFGWEDFVDPDLVIAEYVPNEDLPVVYSSAGVLLNDHWGTMRAWGFVSNRLFDALACATPVISDHLPEVADLFGDAVPTYDTPEQLRRHVQTDLEHPEAARTRAAAGREVVLAAHTFDHRAAELLEMLEKHGIDGAT